MLPGHIVIKTLSPPHTVGCGPCPWSCVTRQTIASYLLQRDGVGAQLGVTLSPRAMPDALDTVTFGRERTALSGGGLVQPGPLHSCNLTKAYLT
jgi:hypothetical protein